MSFTTWPCVVELETDATKTTVGEETLTVVTEHTRQFGGSFTLTSSEVNSYVRATTATVVKTTTSFLTALCPWTLVDEGWEMAWNNTVILTAQADE